MTREELREQLVNLLNGFYDDEKLETINAYLDEYEPYQHKIFETSRIDDVWMYEEPSEIIDRVTSSSHFDMYDTYASYDEIDGEWITFDDIDDVFNAEAIADKLIESNLDEEDEVYLDNWDIESLFEDYKEANESEEDDDE